MKVLILLICAVTIATNGWAADEFTQDPTWQTPEYGQVRAAVAAWLEGQTIEAEVRTRTTTMWPEQPGEAEKAADLLERTAATFAIVDLETKEVVEFCSRHRSDAIPPQFEILTDESKPAFERNNLRLLYGRWLAREHLYDESLAQIGGLKPEEVVDPATLLFYQGLGYHWLLEKEPGLDALGRLLERREDIPRRYETVAELIRSDLTALEDESLDHISRRMADIRRRLDLGRAGPKVREIEDGVVASLDKLIEQAEQQQQQQMAMRARAQGGSQGGQQRGNQQPNAPMPDSRIAPLKGPGEVVKRDIGNKSGWGELPPKEREEAMQQIGKDFPTHYRDAIEQYFKKLASESEGDR